MRWDEMRCDGVLWCVVLLPPLHRQSRCMMWCDLMWCDEMWCDEMWWCALMCSIALFSAVRCIAALYFYIVLIYSPPSSFPPLSPSYPILSHRAVQTNSLAFRSTIGDVYEIPYQQNGNLGVRRHFGLTAIDPVINRYGDLTQSTLDLGHVSCLVEFFLLYCILFYCMLQCSEDLQLSWWILK